MGIYKEMEREQAEAEETLRAENARLQRVVDDLAEVLRTVNARMEQHGVMPGASHLIRKALRTHGLLRPCDDPAQYRKPYGEVSDGERDDA